MRKIRQIELIIRQDIKMGEKLPFPNYVINNVFNVCGYKMQDKYILQYKLYVDTKHHTNNIHKTATMQVGATVKYVL